MWKFEAVSIRPAAIFRGSSKKAFFALAALCFFGSVAAAPPALAEGYVKFSGTQNKSDDHTDEIDVLSWSWGLTQSAFPKSLSGPGTVTIVYRKPLKDGRLAKAKRRSALVVMRKDGTEKRYLLEGVVTGKRRDMKKLGDDGSPLQSLGITYKNIRPAQAAKGGNVETTWKVEEGETSASGKPRRSNPQPVVKFRPFQFLSGQHGDQVMNGYICPTKIRLAVNATWVAPFSGQVHFRGRNWTGGHQEVKASPGDEVQYIADFPVDWSDANFGTGSPPKKTMGFMFYVRSPAGKLLRHFSESGTYTCKPLGPGGVQRKSY